MKPLNFELPSSAVTYQICTLAPRVLVQFAALAALIGATTGCVSAKRYEDAESAARFQAEGRQAEYDRRVAAEERVRELSARLAQQEQAMAQSQSNLASSKFETTAALKERESASLLIEQLQSDLARAGDHLAWFSKEKRDLGKALLLAEQRMDDVDRASGQLGELIGAGRDLALVLGDGSGGLGELGLSARDGRVELEVPVVRLFAEGSEALVVDAAPVLAGVARVASAHEPLKLVLRAPGDSELHQKRADGLSQALIERGVAQARVSIELTPGGEPVPAAAAAPQPSEGSAEAAPEAPAAQPTAAPLKPYVFAFAP
ncbi:MAG TPA: hypothetical protein VM686_29260 [Polyangiaceae bacterium]|nr:hypothetical protein [Polyangiaceae bacterium]